ncbi:MAG TPA: hypothetical protein PKH07_07000 [bacterium]|nr:hypothetical protein [bacterium]
MKKNTCLMSFICVLVLALSWSCVALAVQQETPFIYTTGFEPDEVPAFSVGTLPQNGWESSGTATITDSIAYSGVQSLAISPQATVDKAMDVAGHQEVWLEGWYKTTPEPEYPDLAVLEPGSCLVLFHSIEGISCLDGDGQGNGAWISTGVMVDPARWYRVTIRQNYQTHKWDCFVDGYLKLRGLGFKNNINKLSGFRLQQGENNNGNLDEFVVQTEPLIPSFGYQELFRFSRTWHWLNETPYEAPFNESEFNRYNRMRDELINGSDLTELIKAWHWDR